MKRKPRISRILWHPLLMAGVLALIFTACGGGGGGEPPLTYTGNTSPAIIDETNAEVMAAEAYEQGVGGMYAALGLMLGAGETGQAPAPTFATPVVKTLMAAVEGQDISSFSASDMQIMAAGTQGGSETITGSCGGSATMSGSVTFNDDLTGSMSISAQYHNFCEGNVKMAGGMTMSLTFTYTVDPQTGMEIITPESINIQMTMVMQEVTTGLTLKVEGYDVTMSAGYDATLGMNYYELTIAGGTFYHYDHGYVSVQTTTPMRTYDYDPWPTSGVFVVSAGDRYVSIDADTGDPATYTLDFYYGYSDGSVPPYPMELYWSSPGF